MPAIAPPTAADTNAWRGCRCIVNNNTTVMLVVAWGSTGAAMASVEPGSKFSSCLGYSAGVFLLKIEDGTVIKECAVAENQAADVQCTVEEVRGAAHAPHVACMAPLEYWPSPARVSVYVQYYPRVQTVTHRRSGCVWCGRWAHSPRLEARLERPPSR